MQAKLLHQIRTITAHSDPSVSFAASSPYAGEPRGSAAQNLLRVYGKRNAMVFTIAPIPGDRNKRIRSCVRALLKKNEKSSPYGELVSGNIRLLHSAGDLAAAQAASACVNVLGTSVHDRLDALHIGLPSTVGTPVGVRHLNAKGNALVAKLTFCHKLKHLLACV